MTMHYFNHYTGDQLLRSSLIFVFLILLGCSTSSPPIPEADNPENIPNSGSPDAAVPSDIVSARCDIQPAISWMVSQTILYTQTPNDEWRDCSGNFLRLTSRVATLCDIDTLVAPAGISRFEKGGNNKRPAKAQKRTTRGIAEWYDQRNMFTPVYYDNTALRAVPPGLDAMRNKIKPGTVLWFARSAPLKKNGKLALYKEVGGIINHMGTVVSVKKEGGDVVSWKMYHGANAKKNNLIEEIYWDWSKHARTPFPPGGYYDQRIVGISEHFIPVGSL